MSVQWLIELLNNFQGFSPLNQLVALLALAAPLVGIYAWFRNGYKYGLRSYEEKVAELQRRCEAYQVENADLKAKCAELEQRLSGLERRVPEYVVERAAYERRDDNEEFALRLERELIEEIGPHLATVAANLCRFHMSMCADSGGSHHLASAERFATLVAHLDPVSNSRWALLAEVRETLGTEAFSVGDFAAAARMWDDARSFADPNEGAGILPALFERIVEVRNKGSWQMMLALAQRANTIACRHFGRDDPTTLTGRYYLTQALWLNGLLARALTETEELLALREKVSGPEHPDTLAARHLLAHVKCARGEYNEALREVLALLPLQEKVSGAEHHETLLVRQLLGWVRLLRGECDEAQRELEALLPLRVKVSGAEHPETLNTRYMLSSVRRDLSEYDEAFAELQKLLPLWEKIGGAEHPDTLRTRWPRATVLAETDAVDQTKLELEAVIVMQARVLPADHPHLLDTKFELALLHHRAGSLRAATALMELVIAGRKRRLGPGHPDTKKAAAQLAAMDVPDAADDGTAQATLR